MRTSESSSDESREISYGMLRARVKGVAMLRLTDAQRTVLIQAFPAVAHVAVGTLVFGQFVRQQPLSIALTLAGIGIWVTCVAVAVVLAGGKR